MPTGTTPVAVPAWDRWLPSWPWLVGLVALLRALAAPGALLNDPDTYLHIAAGRWMLLHGALPVADPFSHSMAGAPWIPGEWLAEVVFAAAFGSAGWGGVVALTAIAFAAAVGLLTCFLLRRLAPLPALVAALAAVMLLLPHLLARPHVLALPLLVAWAGVLFAARDEGRGPPWSALPVMALWANLHGSFMFGLALAGFLAAEAVLPLGAGPRATRSGDEPARRSAVDWRWPGFAAAAVAAALATPNGVGGLLQPIRLVQMPALQAGFVEWMPADLVRFPALALWLIGALAVLLGCRMELGLSRVALLLGLAGMALRHVRHADLLALVGPLAVAGALGPRLAALSGPASSPLLRAAAGLVRRTAPPAMAVVFTLGMAACFVAVSDPPRREGDPTTPDAALAAARRMGIAGPVLNDEGFGGYLAFAGVPVFIDGRIEMYGNDFLADYLAAERGDKAELDRLLARYHIAWTMLRPGSAAAAALDLDRGWRRAYADERAVIHVRTR